MSNQRPGAGQKSAGGKRSDCVHSAFQSSVKELILRFSDGEILTESRKPYRGTKRQYWANAAAGLAAISFGNTSNVRSYVFCSAASQEGHIRVVAGFRHRYWPDHHD